MTDQEKDSTDIIKNFSSLLQTYLTKRAALLKLEAADVGTRLFSSLLVYFIIILVSFLVMMMMSVLGGLFFASLFHSNLFGFGLMTALYLLLFILLIAFRKSLIEKFFAEQFLKIIFKNSDQHED